jgi:transposase
MTTPGVSYYSGLTLASRIGPIERFPRPRSLANYFGLTPGCRNSGNAQDRLGSITKQGSKTARFILGQLVLHLLKHDPKMRDWYRRIKLRRGSKIARVAVMRRLTTIFWHMLTYKEPYTIGGPPPRLRQETSAGRQSDAA